MSVYKNLSVLELNAMLDKLKLDLEEIEEERIFVLSQTGLHVPGVKVKQYEAEINETKKRIADIEEILLQTKG